MGGLEHLNLLRMFDIIYSERSLTHAGLALNISESVVDNALHRLRTNLDISLFVHKRRGGMMPTSCADGTALSAQQRYRRRSIAEAKWIATAAGWK
ncbi:LysR family transcriptional regulator (plasmid) [Sphingobium sp. SJ10-10]|uniref:helix-turn-helix domain-containing protein n=1 Tax=Sphingobium sp. SJ10-10 TaxID=3114999 RepID=UPI002E16BC49|nr:LysR family transcriptional regulator [Sphingobium sp. SJ10-10]